ncbi:MAG TPA: polysaccharide deacetylase family protein, partial [Actinomycetes bacterium]|nr:polysaccharide deacetylase family protein [Actinomycetes bacterium]
SAAAYGNLSGDTGYTSNGTNLGSDTRYGLVRGQMATAGSIGTVTATQASTDAWQRVVFTLVGAVVTQTHEITLARESTTSVAAVGSVTEGVSTHEIVLALESTTSFTIGGGGYLEGPRGTLFEDFSDTAEYTVGGSGSLSLDTVHVREGLSGHVKLTTATGTACSMARTLPSTVDLSGVNSIELWFYVDAPGYGGTSSYFNMTQTVRLGESSSVYWQRTNHGGNMHPGWNVARWDRSSSANFSANGGISSWANIDYIYFGFTSPTTSAPNGVSITYCTLRAGAMGPRAAFLMTYDDGLESVYNVGRSIVNGLGMHTTAYVSSERVDPGDESTSYMSTAQWQTLASEGHYIGNHTTDHYDLTTLNQTEFDAAVGDCTDYIQAITGLEDHGVHGAYPLGWQNSTVHGYMADLGGQLTWRSVGGVNADGAEAHLWPLSVASQADAEQSSLATWQALIDIAVNTGEAVVALVHDPGNAHYGTSMTTQQFTDVCTYAATTKEMWCPNVDEWWEYAIAPGVGKIDATWEITLGLESTTSVAAAPTEVPGTTTHEITLALESATAVTAAGSITHAVYEVTLSLESLSSVAVEPLVTQAIHEIILALESTTAVTIGSTGVLGDDSTDGGGTTGLYAGNELQARRFTLSESCTVTSMSIRARYAGGTYAEGRLLIYADDGSDYPGALQCYTGIHTLTTSDSALSVHTEDIIGGDATLEPGNYWLVHQWKVGSDIYVAQSTQSGQVGIWSGATWNETPYATFPVGQSPWGPDDEIHATYSTPGVVVTHAIHEITLAVESTSSVAIVPTEVPGGTTHEVTLALESTTSVSIGNVAYYVGAE